MTDQSTVTAQPTKRWSVMIPAHNCADYLAETLPEVVSQLGARRDAEIVVVDDGSTDDPESVVRALGHEQVRYSPNPSRLGAIGTFNRCLELADGELVHILHGDDLVLPGFYEAMEAALADTPALGAMCRTQYIDGDSSPHGTSRRYRHGTGVWPQALESFAVSNRVRAPSIVVRSGAYAEFGGFRTDLPHAADWEAWTRLAANGPIVFVDEVLAAYRRHAASDTAARVKTGDNIRERVTAIKLISQYIPADRRASTIRRALVYSSVYATRTSAQLARRGSWPAARTQAREAVRCLMQIPGGLRSMPSENGADASPVNGKTVDGAAGSPLHRAGDHDSMPSERGAGAA